MASSWVAINIILSAVLAAAGIGAPSRAADGGRRMARIDALPLASTWTQAVDGAAPASAAAGSTEIVAGWADHLDVFLVDSGAKAWSLPIPALRTSCDGRFCVVADGTVVRGIDLERRSVRWQQPLDQPLAAAPALRSGWVILAGTGGRVRALQATDGREVWSFNAGSAISGAPSINGNHVAIATANATVSLLDLATGKPVWTIALDHAPGALRLGGGSVIVGTDNGRLVVRDETDGRLRFETRTGANVTGTPALDEENFYSVGQDGVLRAFDRGNGAQRWYANLTTRAADGPFVDGDLVFVPLRTGAIDVRLHDGKAAAQLPAPAASARLPVPPLVAGSGASLSIITVSYDPADTAKWSLSRYATAAALTPVATPSTIPGLALTLTPPN